MLRIQRPSLLAALLILVLTNLSVAQSIKIRLIDGSKNKSISKQKISVSFLYDKELKTAPSSSKSIELETNSAGEAEFNLPAPTPNHISVRPALNPGHWHCGCILLTPTRDVMSKGVLISSSAKGTFEAKPGEVVFVAVSLSVMERLFYPLTKD